MADRLDGFGRRAKPGRDGRRVESRSGHAGHLENVSFLLREEAELSFDQLPEIVGHLLLDHGGSGRQPPGRLVFGQPAAGHEVVDEDDHEQRIAVCVCVHDVGDIIGHA